MLKKFIIILICSIYFSNFLQVTKCNSTFVFSIPKCGTHLVAKAIELLTNKKLDREIKTEDVKNGLPNISNNIFYRCHLPYIKTIHNQIKENKFKVFFIYRDPRDQIVSRAFWIQKRLLNEVCKKKGFCNNISNLIDYLINNIDNYYKKFLPWKNAESICTLKFENLIGAAGKSNAILQKNEIQKICNHLNINSKKLIDYCMNNLYGGTYTFREGKIGSWKKYFNESQKNKFKKIAGKLLIELGYEKNNNW